MNQFQIRCSGAQCETLSVKARSEVNEMHNKCIIEFAAPPPPSPEQVSTREKAHEMTLYSDNGYDVTIFCCLKSSCLILHSYQVHCCQIPNGRVKLGDFFAPPHPL